MSEVFEVGQPVGWRRGNSGERGGHTRSNNEIVVRGERLPPYARSGPAMVSHRLTTAWLQVRARRELRPSGYCRNKIKEHAA